MKTKVFFLAIFFISISPAQAQTDKILNEKDITETAIIEALIPTQDSNAAGRTRGIRVNRESMQTMVADTPSKTASASLLISFQTNSARLTPNAKQALNVVSKALNSEQLIDFQFSIQGHADPRGDPISNLKLSQRRAESVRQYLVQNQHIEDQRLKAIGKGDKEPLNIENPIAPENRRVTIVTVTP